jgi:hypothetical protein
VAEVVVPDGTWTFDGELVRVVPGQDRKVHKLRQQLGELTVPLRAIAGVTYEPGKKGGRLRLRLRDGADPFLQVAGGKLKDDQDPYRLRVDQSTATIAEYMVDEIRNALLIEQVPPGPCDKFVLPGPAVPVTANAGDASISFNGRLIHIEWTEWAESSKKNAGPQEIALEDVTGIEWVPIVGWTNGFLRFRVAGASALEPKYDPYCATWGWQELGGMMPLLAAAVAARLAHPSASHESPPAAPAITASPDGDGQDDEPDALLRQLRELGDLHSKGVLTDDEFAAAKQALLKRL